MAWTRQESADFAALKTMVGEIHQAVIGDGSAGSSLRERVSVLETDKAHQSSFKYRSVTTGATAVLSAALAYLTHALTTASTH